MIKIRFEFEPHYCWVGVFWKQYMNCRLGMDGTEDRWACLDVWVCLVPCLPIRLCWIQPTEQSALEWSKAHRAVG